MIAGYWNRRAKVKGSGAFKLDDLSSYIGKARRSNGQAWETWLERFFANQQNRFGHVIEKTPEPMKVLSSARSGKFTACFVKRAQPDFKGVLRGITAEMRGRACVLEAKSSQGKSIAFSLVQEHQLTALFRYWEAGACAGIIISLNNRTDFFLIPLSDWFRLPTVLGKKSANVEDLEKWRFNFDNDLSQLFKTKT